MLPELGFEDPRLLYLYVGVFVLAHLLLFAVIYLRSNAAGGLIGPAAGQAGGEPRAPDAVPPENLPPVDSDTTIECEHCGAANQPEFRYCRNCVADLGRGLSARSGGAGQSQQRPF